MYIDFDLNRTSLKELIVNSKKGIYKINADHEEKFKEQLRKYNKLFDKYNLMWLLDSNYDNYILFVIIDDFNADR